MSAMKINLNKKPNLSSSTDIFIEILNHNFHLENFSSSSLATNPSKVYFLLKQEKNDFTLKNSSVDTVDHLLEKQIQFPGMFSRVKADATAYNTRNFENFFSLS